jgi:hypothetical protein
MSKNKELKRRTPPDDPGATPQQCDIAVQRGILVMVDNDFVPADGTAFDAVQAALDHFEIPATMVEGAFIPANPVLA